MKIQNSKFKIQNIFTGKSLWIILGLVLFLAAFLRFYQLAQVPPSPDWDEVALGYDAYSIIHTGRDEYGKFLPVVLRSFDDYKPALYAYLVIPPVLLFDVTTYAVRFPSAFFGVLTVLATFFLVQELFKKNSLALLSALFMAISPWSIQFSRVGFESNVGAALNLFAALFFLKGLKKPWLLMLATFFAGLGLYVYQSEKVFTPLLMGALIVIFLKQLIKLPKKFLVLAIIVGAVTVLPMVTYILTDKNALLRVKGTLVYSDQTAFLKQNVIRLQQDRANHDKLGIILDNRRIEYAKATVFGYLSHYDLNWLFIKGDIARHHAPNMGLMYIVSLPFFLFGIYGLFFGFLPFVVDKKSRILLLTWFLLVPVPASITSGVPHAVRTLNFIPVVEIFVAVGVFVAFAFVKNLQTKKIKIPLAWIFTIIVVFAYLFNFAYYLDQYFVQLNIYDSADWQFGYKEAVAQVKQIAGNYSKIVVSQHEPLDKSYMFFLFYLKYPPAEYQKVGQYSSGGFRADHGFDKYQFHEIDWANESAEKHVLFIGTPSEFPSDAKVLKTIYDLGGNPVIKIVES